MAVWQSQLDGDGSAVRTGFCADCHNLNPNWELDSSDTTRPNNRSHPQGPGTDSKMEVYGETMTVAAHPLERMGCRGCHYASVGDDGAGVSRFPHQSVGWKLLFDEATMTGGTSDLAGDPQRIIPGMDLICLSCHAVFTELATESGKCLNCHDSKYGAPDIGDEIRKAFGMGIQDISSTHTASSEGAGDFADGSRHAKCDDCHNASKIFPWEDTPLTGMGGIARTYADPGVDYQFWQDLTFSTTPAIEYQSELCYKCHSSWTTQPLSTTYKNFKPAYAEWWLDDGAFLQQGDKALEFIRNNSAFHPIEGAGRNQSINLCFQLKDAFDLDCDTPAAAATSLGDIRLKCTDCHNNYALGEAGVRGYSSNYTGPDPIGPHGSDESTWTLRAGYDRDLTYTLGQYRQTSTTVIQDSFALCFSCHDYDTLLGDKWYSKPGGTARTNFWSLRDGAERNLHEYHVTRIVEGESPWEDARAKCPDCHYNVHSNQAANNSLYEYGTPQPFLTDRTHLINFAPHVQGYTYSKPRYNHWTEGSWPGYGYDYSQGCNLKCHNSTGGLDVMARTYNGPPSDEGQDTASFDTYPFNP